MGYEYAQKRRGTAAPGNGGVSNAPERSFPNSARLDALKSGTMRPTTADKGHRLELQAAMRTKMERSFGADLSSVKMYESQTVADAGAEAVAQGNEIAFAPGKTDFSSQSGQALLGHELSHVVSQSRGEVTGGGFLADSGLEARADREGAMAARGETIYSGEMNGRAIAPLSSASAAPMAGPMQAKKKKKASNQKVSSNPHAGMQGLGDWKPTAFEGAKVDPNLVGTPEVENKDIFWKGMKDGYDEHKAKIDPRMNAIKDVGRRKDADVIKEKLHTLYEDYDFVDRTLNPMTNTEVVGLDPRRMGVEMMGSLSGDMTPKEIEDMYRNILAPQKKGLDKNDAKSVEEANNAFDKGMMQLKVMQYKQLKRLEKTYGTLGSQMHPEDFIKQAGSAFAEQSHFAQDIFQMMDNGGGKYFDFENNEQDKEYRRLANYYGEVAKIMSQYGTTRDDEEQMMAEEDEDMRNLAKVDVENGIGALDARPLTPENEKGIGGPKMNKKALKAYKKGLKRRAKAGGWTHRLFGGFK